MGRKGGAVKVALGEMKGGWVPFIRNYCAYHERGTVAVAHSGSDS